MLTGDLTTATALVEEEQSLSTMTRVAPIGYSSLLLDAFRGDAARAIPVIRSTIETATRDGQGGVDLGQIVKGERRFSPEVFGAEVVQDGPRQTLGSSLGWGQVAYFIR